MRVLTVRQPWAWAIIHGGKDVENRVRNIAGSYRGSVAIHAAKVNDLEAWTALGRTDLAAYSRALDVRESLIGGAIIGVVDLVDVHSPAPDLTRDEFCQSPLGDLCSPWAQIEAWHLVLANPRPIAEPIPYRGALGLRMLDADTISRIEAVLA